MGHRLVVGDPRDGRRIGRQETRAGLEFSPDCSSLEGNMESWWYSTPVMNYSTDRVRDRH